MRSSVAWPNGSQTRSWPKGVEREAAVWVRVVRSIGPLLWAKGSEARLSCHPLGDRSPLDQVPNINIARSCGALCWHFGQIGNYLPQYPKKGGKLLKLMDCTHTKGVLSIGRASFGG